VLFADDTCFTLADNILDTLIYRFNTELKKFDAWLNYNRLSLNYTKTVAVNFSKRIYEHVNPLKINSVDFNYVNITKYLGITIDKNLTFSSHIDIISNKISKNVGIIYRVSHFAESSITLRLYHAIVSPYLNYCNLNWGGAAKSHLNKLLKLQKRVVRIIANAEFLAHTEPLFKRLELLTIENVYKFACCTYVFKNRYNYATYQNVYNTRNSNTVFVRSQD